VRVEHRVSACDIKIGHALLHAGAHVHGIVNDPTGIFQADRDQPGVPFGENVTVFAPLIAGISDVPLECEVLKHYFAPQAEPQAAGFCSGSAAPQALGLGSAAPQALPQAAGFSSGLAAPQALPQADGASFAKLITNPEMLDLFMCGSVEC